MSFRLSQEEKQRIIQLRNSGKSIREIQEIVGFSFETVRKTINENAANLTVRAPAMLICPHCGAENPVAAKFCNMCGKELLTKKQMAAKNLLAVRNECVKFLPQSMRQAADEAMMEAVKLLEEKE